MAIVINGSGTITGISQGGLPDDVITADDIKDADYQAPLTAGTDYLAPDGDGSSLTGLAGGFYESYAIICEEKANGSGNGGTATGQTWMTRNLNTELYDADNIVSISSNQFTLGAGTYTLYARAPAYQVDQHLSALYSVTDSSYVRYGVIEYTNINDSSVISHSDVYHTFTISGSKTYEIRHWTDETRGSGGLGLGFAPSPATNIFTIVQIWKHS